MDLASSPSNEPQPAATPASPIRTPPNFGPGEEWTELGPHIVILPGNPLDPPAYGTDHDGGGPWVMRPGTYEHLHMPGR